MSSSGSDLKQGNPSLRRKALRNPLSPTTYLLRNAGKTTPLIGVIMLAVMLVAGIIALIDSIPFSIRTIYDYSSEMVGITPRGDGTQTAKLVQEIKAKAPVPIERMMICRASSTQVQSIVGKWPFVVLALEQNDMRYYLKRMGATTMQGRFPRPGEPEALVSRPVATNLGLKIYDPNASAKDRAAGILLGPDKTDSYSPKYVKVVGIVECKHWIMLAPVEYHRANHFPPIDLAMAFAQNKHDQSILDHWTEKHFKGQRAQIFAWHQVEKSTNEMFQTLYRILDVVIGVLVLVITFMMGMLMNIYQSQRLVEFGLLQAIGYTKRQLLRRVVLESVIVVMAGWVFGVVAANGLLAVVSRTLMEPKAFALDTHDRMAYLYTVPLPFAILFVALVTVSFRFRKFDPVGVVERRLV